jgi:hypothetical protein
VLWLFAVKGRLIGVPAAVTQVFPPCAEANPDRQKIVTIKAKIRFSNIFPLSTTESVLDFVCYNEYDAEILAVTRFAEGCKFQLGLSKIVH